VGLSKLTAGLTRIERGALPWVSRQWKIIKLASASITLLFLIAFILPEAQPAEAASVSSDQTQITQIEQRIAAQGALIQKIVTRYDATQAEAATLAKRLAAAQIQLAADQTAEAAAMTRLRRIAIYAYESGGGLSPALSLFTTSSVNTMLIRSEYVDIAGGNMNNAINTYHEDQRRTEATAKLLRFEQSRTKATLIQLTRQRQAVQAAIASDESTLEQVKGNLQAILAAAAAKQAAEQRLAEQRLARQEDQQAAAAAHQSQPSNPAPSTPSTPSTPAPSTPAPSTPSTPAPSTPSAPAPISPSPGVYANPLRAINALSPERIDQGVDYSGYGPIYAIGDGIVLNTVNSGWPGGTFITYRLTDGPAAGLVVYAAEDIYPMVQVGQTVTPNTVLGTVYEGPDGIETGWSDPSGQGYTMAHDYGQFNGSNSTAFGYNFSQLLQSLGAPGGILQNDPPTGNLPPGWPTW